eukprot:gnl/MRDRNA2_/MRDRNA2_175586_c0_seq1.p1 gnl/MRDRNA2_/MRDRNA2_175586_c0~~gnl/MRDRNA2_/MRDRNA2_175586_c0_seq1.p1  ORF type:complete len:227 (+),score=20.29 gnl/MRDRNA2_/MRDRNA2_175586_c0_seq1:60-683(+)
MASPGINSERQLLIDAIEAGTPIAAAAGRPVDLRLMGASRQVVLSPAGTIKAMSNATFCPIPQGDEPYTKRFFLSLLVGCIPVMVNHRGSWHKKGGPKWQNSLPFSRLMNYRSLVVTIPPHKVPQMVQTLLTIKEEKIQRKRQAIKSARRWLVWDYEGGSSGWRGDAFSALLLEVRRLLAGHNASEAAVVMEGKQARHLALNSPLAL